MGERRKRFSDTFRLSCRCVLLTIASSQTSLTQRSWTHFSSCSCSSSRLNPIPSIHTEWFIILLILPSEKISYFLQVIFENMLKVKQYFLVEIHGKWNNLKMEQAENETKIYLLGFMLLLFLFFCFNFHHCLSSSYTFINCTI